MVKVAIKNRVLKKQSMISTAGGFLFPHGSEIISNPTYKSQFRFAINNYKSINFKKRSNKFKHFIKKRNGRGKRSKHRGLKTNNWSLPKGMLHLNLYSQFRFVMFFGGLKDRLDSYTTRRSLSGNSVFLSWFLFYLNKRWLRPGVFK